MDIYEIRRENLRAIVEELGSQTALADRLGIDPSTLSQILGGGRNRNVGHRLARRVEAAAGKVMGWLDTSDHSVAGGPKLSPFGERIARAAENLGPDERETLEHVLSSLEVASTGSHRRIRK